MLQDHTKPEITVPESETIVQKTNFSKGRRSKAEMDSEKSLPVENCSQNQTTSNMETFPKYLNDRIPLSQW